MYAAQSQSGHSVVLADPDRELRVGQKLIFDKQYVGFVKATSDVDRTATALVREDVKVTFAELDTWWTIKQPASTKLLVPPSFFVPPGPGLLRAECRVSGTYLAGRIGWLLTYEVGGIDTKVAMGNDMLTPTIITLNTNGMWPAGSYTLIAQRYVRYQQPAAEAAISWTVRQPQYSLLCGNEDIHPPLNLVI